MKRLYRATSLLLALFALLPLLACGGQSEEVRDLPFNDITNGSHTWKVETCRLLTDGNVATLRGKIKNTSPWPTAGLTMYVIFYDASGEAVATGSCMTSYAEAIAPNASGTYAVKVLNFYQFDRIASVTIEFDD